MIEVDIFEHAISNVNFVEGDDGLLLFIYTTFEVNTDDVRLYVDELDNKKFMYLHYPSDNLIKIEIENPDIFDKINKSNILKVFEIDTVDGEMVNYYNAIK